MKLEELAAEAALLDEESRASLASQLLRSLRSPAGIVSDEEVFQRMQEAEADPSVMLTYEKFISGIDRRGH